MISSGGPAIPSLDPMLTGTLNWAHLTTPQSSAFLTGTNSLIQRQAVSNFGIQQSFLTGTAVSLGLNNTSVNSNNPRSDFNPATTSSLSLGLTQHLFQGFGPGVNSRQIRIAKNNREVSDLTFKLQVETTVAAVMELYWDLVAFNESVQVARDALGASQHLLEDNRKQVEVGTLAQIEVVRAEAEIASAEQALLVAQTRALQQETILKTALSRTGVASPAIADRAYHHHGPHTDSGRGTRDAHPGHERARHLFAAGTGAEPHPTGQPGADRAGIEKRLAAHPRSGRQRE